jgi:hypothetical protein
MARFYAKLSETGKNVFILTTIAIIGFVLLTPFFLLGNAGLPLGWLLGSTIEVLCYLSIVFGSGLLTNTGGKKGAVAAGLAVLFYSLRLICYAGGLVLGGLCTFKWKNDLLSVWTVFAGYLPLLFVLAVSAFVKSKKEKKHLMNKSVDIPSDEKAGEGEEHAGKI